MSLDEKKNNLRSAIDVGRAAGGQLSASACAKIAEYATRRLSQCATRKTIAQELGISVGALRRVLRSLPKSVELE